MPWGNEQRWRRAKRVWNVDNPRNYRVSCSNAVLHYPSVLDSRIDDTEVDLRLVRRNTGLLNGWVVDSNGYRFAYQGFPATGGQSPIGTLGYGGRQGAHFLTMRPHRVGYLHWRSRTFEPIGGQTQAAQPTFGTPVRENHVKTIGINDADPSVWDINAGFTATIPGVWTIPSEPAASIDWQIRASGGMLKQDWVINQAARDWIRINAPPTTPAPQTWFGIAYQVDFTGIPQGENEGSVVDLLDNDFEVGERFILRDAIGRRLGQFGNGEIYVKGRGGRVPIRKRFYFDGTRWWFFIGANVRDISRDLMQQGDLIIDPPIGEEDIVANADDASQGVNDGTQMNLSGSYGGLLHIGDYTYQYHVGFIFRTVPIGNGDTINSATLEPMVANAPGGTLTYDLFGIDEDDAATFPTTASDISDRARTASSTTVDDGDWPTAGNRDVIDVAAQVGDITTRTLWDEEGLGFVLITTTNTNQYANFDDYSAGAADACDFNADVTAAAGDVLMGQVWM